MLKQKDLVIEGMKVKLDMMEEMKEVIAKYEI